MHIYACQDCIETRWCINKFYCIHRLSAVSVMQYWEILSLEIAVKLSTWLKMCWSDLVDIHQLLIPRGIHESGINQSVGCLANLMWQIGLTLHGTSHNVCYNREHCTLLQWHWCFLHAALSWTIGCPHMQYIYKQTTQYVCACSYTEGS